MKISFISGLIRFYVPDDVVMLAEHNCDSIRTSGKSPRGTQKACPQDQRLSRVRRAKYASKESKPYSLDNRRKDTTGL